MQSSRAGRSDAFVNTCGAFAGTLFVPPEDRVRVADDAEVRQRLVLVGAGGDETAPGIVVGDGRHARSYPVSRRRNQP
jgi:hypothetical protein